MKSVFVSPSRTRALVSSPTNQFRTLGASRCARSRLWNKLSSASHAAATACIPPSRSHASTASMSSGQLSLDSACSALSAALASVVVVDAGAYSSARLYPCLHRRASPPIACAHACPSCFRAVASSLAPNVATARASSKSSRATSSASSDGNAFGRYSRALRDARAARAAVRLILRRRWRWR